jgi:hypothetical protein
LTSRSPSLLRLLLINGAVFLVLLLLLELALRLLGIARPAFYRFDPVRGFAHRPGAEGWWTREGRGWVRINRAGFRDDDHPPTARPGVLRLAVLADSFGEAFQVNLADTWWKGLERQLRQRPDCPLRRGDPAGVEVMNFGTGAYGTGQELLTWRQAVRPLRPGVVLLAMYLGNDLDDNTPRPRDDRPVFRLDGRGRLQLDDSFLQSPASRFRRSLPGRVSDWLVAHSRLAQLLNAIKNRPTASGAPTGDGPPPVPPPSEEGWGVTAALLRQLRDEVKASGGRLIVTSLSSPEQVWPVRGRRPADAFDRERRLASVLAPLGVTYLPLAPELQRQADRRGLTLHGFEGQQPGIGHWNADGHRLAAAVLAADLCRP